MKFMYMYIWIFLSYAEPVAVGIVVKNPLAIPLVMTRFTLVWQFSTGSTPSSTPSSTPLLSPKSPLSPSSAAHNSRGFPAIEEKPAASCQVIEQIELNPNEQRMVSCENKLRQYMYM